MGLKQDAARELIWRRCKRDPIFAFQNFFMIQHPEGRRLFTMRDPQKEALTNWLSGGNWLTLKARQIGWSTLVASYCLWNAVWFPDKSILIISRGEREAQEVLAKVKFMWERLPPWIRDKAPRVTNDTLQNLWFDNGSKINSLPSASNPGRGFSGSLVVVDEWAFIPNQEDAWASIEPVADIGGQIIGLSTANGSGNWFHNEWLKATEGISPFKPMFYSWRAVSDRDEEWFERKCLEMLPWIRAQEYPNDPEEAFAKSGNPVFGDLLDGLVAKAGTVGFVTRQYDFITDLGGNVTQFGRPIPGEVYAIGADVAEGLGHGDYSSAHVLHVRTGEEVAHYHARIDTDQFSDHLFALGRYYNNALLGPEANNHGLTVVTLLRKMGYPSLFRRRQLNSAQLSLGIQFGWQTSKVSKPLMIDELAYSMRIGEILIHSARTIKELRLFVRDDKGQMHGSPHDDCVISLAIANQMRKYAFQPESYGQTNEVWGTMNWWEKELDKDREPIKKDRPLVMGGRPSSGRSRHNR